MKSRLKPFPVLPNVVAFTIFAAFVVGHSAIQVNGQIPDTPQLRMRPIGTPSNVDRYRRTRFSENHLGASHRGGAVLRETAFRDSRLQSGNPTVRQTAMQFGLPNELGGGTPATAGPSQPFALPSSPLGDATVPAPSRAPQTMPVPSLQTAPQAPSLPQAFSPPANALPTGPQPGLPAPSNLPSATDLTPLAPPSLGTEYATVSNSVYVTGPSGYSASMGSGCVPANYQRAPLPGSFIAPPAQIPAPAVLPPTRGSVVPSTAGSPISSSAGPASALVTFGQEFNPVQVGPGLLGQPKAYVPGQYFRNWLRYFTP